MSSKKPSEALFLASDASRFVTAQNVVVDGGISAGWPIAAARPDRELFLNTIQASFSAPFRITPVATVENCDLHAGLSERVAAIQKLNRAEPGGT